DGTWMGRDRSQKRCRPAQGCQGCELTRQSAIFSHVKLADRQRHAALGMGKQVLVAPPAHNGAGAGLFLDPRGPMHAEKLGATRDSRREKHRRAATADEGLDLLARLRV